MPSMILELKCTEDDTIYLSSGPRTLREATLPRLTAGIIANQPPCRKTTGAAHRSESGFNLPHIEPKEQQGECNTTSDLMPD